MFDVEHKFQEVSGHFLWGVVDVFVSIEGHLFAPCYRTNFYFLCEELERLFPTEIGEHLPDGIFGLVKGKRKIRNGSMCSMYQ